MCSTSSRMAITLDFFVLYMSRAWALATAGRLHNANECGVRVHLRVGDNAPLARYILSDVPQSYGLHPIDSEWMVTSSVNGDIVYCLGPKEKQNVHIRIFEDRGLNNTYAGLYDDDGRRWTDTCLIFWNTDQNPGPTNIGYAPGRCPDKVDLAV